MPESAIVFRLGRVLGTTMPETTINEDGQSCFPKYEIRFAEDVLISPPSIDAMPPQ